MKEPFDFGLALKTYRQRKGWTQKQLGDVIGQQTSTISGYELNTTTPSWPAIVSIAAALDIDLNVLAGLKKDHKTIVVDGLSDTAINALQQVVEELRNK